MLGEMRKMGKIQQGGLTMEYVPHSAQSLVHSLFLFLFGEEKLCKSLAGNNSQRVEWQNEDGKGLAASRDNSRLSC